jgi:serine/threonine protein kinase/tetratricopeptide (TPR) repeat protein
MTLDPRLPELFAEARERLGEERESYLAALGREAPELAAEVRALLESGADGERRFAGTVWERFASAEESLGGLPKRIGPYRIVAELGHGGMGRVFLAEEVREAFQRQLALKVIDRPWRASDRARRFRSEVRILASLEHPGIARFLEGGELADGTLFLALEYVQGEDLLTFAEQRGLSTDERVRLVVEVLGAVAYAHEQGVVHRDLKPANILVDRFGRTRLLDFGVAKLLDGEDAPQHHTELALRMFTPAYASPEQFAGEPVSAATDIYSAGVLLYELLTGSRPFGGSGTSRSDLEREVLASEPRPPSVRLRETTAATTAKATTKTTTTATAKRRGSRTEDAAEGQRREIARGLDAVCLQALRREPAERYPSARAFAADLERYLAGEAVEARLVSARSGARSGLRGQPRARWRLAALAALLIAAVAAGLVTSRGGEPVAPAAAAARPFPFSAAAMPALGELVRRFDAEPANVDAGAGLAIALVREQRPEEAALIVARLRQIPTAADDPLVDYVEATIAVHRGTPQQALILFERALGRAVATGRGELIGQIRAARGRLLGTLGRRAEAKTEMETAIAEFERAGDPASLARVQNDLAIELAQANDLAGASRLLERALAATRAASPTNSGATILANLGSLQVLRGRPDLAEIRLREVVGIFRSLDRPPKLAFALDNLAQALWEQGRASAARDCIDEAIELGRSGPAASILDAAYLHRGQWDLEQGAVGSAIAAAEGIERLAREVGTSQVAARGAFLGGLVARTLGRPAEALERFATARRLFAGAGATEQVAELDLEEAGLLSSMGELAQARVRVDATVEPLRGHGDRVDLLAGEILLVRLDVREGDLESAARRLALLRSAGEKSPVVGLRIALLAAGAELAKAEGRSDDARRILESARRLAEEAGRKATALELRLDRAAVDLASGNRQAALRESAEVERMASAVGWLAIETRARGLAP